MSRIIEVCRKYGLSKARLVSPSKRRRLVPPRHEAQFGLVVVDGLSLGIVARMTGRRHHTTVLYAVRKYARQALGTPPDASLAEIRQAWAQRQGAQP